MAAPATRYIAVASPGAATNAEWKAWYARQGIVYTEPPPVYKDYALLKVLYMLRLYPRTPRIHAFQWEDPPQPLDFSGLRDSDMIFVVGHGNQSGLYALGPSSNDNVSRLIQILTKDGNLASKRKNKQVNILLLSCRAGLGLHKGLARKLSKQIAIDTNVGGAQGFTFGSIRTSSLARNEVLIRGLPWYMEYDTSISIGDAEKATSAREGTTITYNGKKTEIDAFTQIKKKIEDELKGVAAQLRSTEINAALDEIESKYRTHWLGACEAQFEHYALAKKRSNLEFDMWYNLITEGYLWSNGVQPTDQQVDVLLAGDLVPTDAGLTSVR
jgi:hypothetical protein